MEGDHRQLLVDALLEESVNLDESAFEALQGPWERVLTGSLQIVTTNAMATFDDLLAGASVLWGAGDGHGRGQISTSVSPGVLYECFESSLFPRGCPIS